MLRGQNSNRPKNITKGYYVNHRQYPAAYVRNDYQTRTGRRSHDSFALNMNYGLDTQTDELNSSPFSSPYYINGRFNVDSALVTQRGNSASVQGIKKLLAIHNYKDSVAETMSGENPDALTETSLTMWQGKQIKFSVPYNGKIVETSLRIKNTDGCRGILSVYLSKDENSEPAVEVSVDLCNVSEDKFDTVTLTGANVFPAKLNPKGQVFVRMEIWNEITKERSRNPFNTGKKIEIAATGAGEHKSWTYTLSDKNLPVKETPAYESHPSRPLIGFTYNDYESVPTERIDNEKIGGTVSKSGYRYDIFCAKDGSHAEVIIYDKEMNRTIDNQIKVDSRIEQLCVVQVTDTDRVTWVYYVDGYSPLQRFKIGEWVSSAFPTGSGDTVTAQIDNETWYNSDLGAVSGTYIFTYHNGHWEYNETEVSLDTYGISLVGGGPSEGSTITVLYTVSEGGTKNIESIQFVDARPVIAAKMIMFHNNRLYLAGFRNDPNLIQVSAINKAGPDFTQFPYRFDSPNRSPYDTSLNPVTALVENASDQIMILHKNLFSIYATYGSSSSTGLEDGTPTQVSSYVDSAGVESLGDVVNYKGIIYSFNAVEGLRRFTGALWTKLPASVDTHYDRIDMTKPRKLWGHANKLYYNYTDKVDGKRKALIWDMQMNYQQYPWFQDVDIPVCDVRFDETGEITGIHPDYPCIMEHYAEDTWHRMDTPITFERHTKYLTVPGNAADQLVQRVHNKVLANCNRWWWVAIAYDKYSLEQHRGNDVWYRMPCWDTITDEEPVESPFPTQDIYEQDALARLTLPQLKIRCQSVQAKIKAKTFRRQASLVSTVFEIMPIPYL